MGGLVGVIGVTSFLAGIALTYILVGKRLDEQSQSYEAKIRELKEQLAQPQRRDHTPMAPSVKPEPMRVAPVAMAPAAVVPPTQPTSIPAPQTPAAAPAPISPPLETQPDLAKQILAWGNSLQTDHLPQLMALCQGNSLELRTYSLMAIAHIASAQGSKAANPLLLKVLDRLLLDPAVEVRQGVVQVLQHLKTAPAMALLNRARHDATPAVAQMASHALSQFRYVRKPVVKKIKHS